LKFKRANSFDRGSFDLKVELNTLNWKTPTMALITWLVSHGTFLRVTARRDLKKFLCKRLHKKWGILRYKKTGFKEGF